MPLKRPETKVVVFYDKYPYLFYRASFKDAGMTLHCNILLILYFFKLPK